MKLLKSHQIDMLHGPLHKKMLIFIVPVFLTNMIQILYNSADMAIVGKFAADGSGSLAAVGATTSLYHLIVNIFLGIGLGVGVDVSRHIGAQNKETVYRAVQTSFWLALICGVVIGTLGFIFTPAMLTTMKTDTEVISRSILYLRIILLGSPLMLLSAFGTEVLRVTGDTVRPLIFLASSGLCNIIFNIIFVLAFKMDVAGVACATVISQAISSALVWYSIISDKSFYSIDLRHPIFDFKEMRTILLVGIPSGIQKCAYSFSNVILQSNINAFGKYVTAGTAAAVSVEQVSCEIGNAVSSATLTFTSQNYGAGNKKRIKNVILNALLIALYTQVFCNTLVILFKVPLLSLFNDELSVIVAGCSHISVYTTTYIICAFYNITNAQISGIGHPITASCISLFSIVIGRLTFIWGIFPRLEGTFSNLISVYPFSWILALSLTIPIMIIYTRKLKFQNENK